jgi:acyl-CoA thioesterase-1
MFVRFCFLFCLFLAVGVGGNRLGGSLALSASGAESPKTILVLGDSIAAGYGLEPEQAFPALLQEKISEEGLNWKVVNGGLSGDTTAGGLRRLDWLLKQKVDLLLVELGGNDGLRGITPSETRKNLLGIVEKAKVKNPGIRIIIAGMQMPPSMGVEYTKEYREVFPAVAKEAGAALVPFLLEGVAARANLNQPDRIHPTAEGHKIVAENVWKILRPILEGGVSKSAAK